MTCAVLPPSCQPPFGFRPSAFPPSQECCPDACFAPAGPNTANSTNNGLAIWLNTTASQLGSSLATCDAAGNLTVNSLSFLGGAPVGIVTSIAGTANEILVNGGIVPVAGAVTLSLPTNTTFFSYLGTGSPSATTFLRGDGSWQTPPLTPPAGATNSVQINGGGTFAAAASLSVLGNSLQNVVSGNNTQLLSVNENISSGTAAVVQTALTNLFDNLYLALTGTGYSGSFLSGGPAGEAGYLYTTSTVPLTLGTNSISRLIVSSAGTVTIPNLSVAGVVLNSAAGLLTTHTQDATLLGFLGSGTPSAANFLRGDGSWQAVSASAGGSNTQVQYNSTGALAGTSGLTWNGAFLLNSQSQNSSQGLATFQNPNTGTAAIGTVQLSNASHSLVFSLSGTAFSGAQITGSPSGESAGIYTAGSIPLFLGTAATANLTILSGGAATFSSSLTVTNGFTVSAGAVNLGSGTTTVGGNLAVTGTSTLTGNVTVGAANTVAGTYNLQLGNGGTTVSYFTQFIINGTNAGNAGPIIIGQQNSVSKWEIGSSDAIQGGSSQNLSISSVNNQNFYTGGIGGTLVLTLDTAQGATFAKGVSFGTTTSFPTGSIGVNAANGMTIIGKPGSTADLSLTNGTGLVAIYVPTGTQDVVIGTGKLLVSSGITSASPSAGVGYSTGAGGTVTQITSKATGVTLNKVSGGITMNNAALANLAAVSFVLTNSSVGANDTVDVSIASGTTGLYSVWCAQVTAGTCTIGIQNLSGGTLSDAIVLNFNVIKGAHS